VVRNAWLQLNGGHTVAVAWSNLEVSHDMLPAGITDLHFHGLRCEYGSRLIEAPGVHPALVRDWLGHANITTTSRYLTTSAQALVDAARKFEASRAAFAHDPHKPGSEGDAGVEIEIAESNEMEVVENGDPDFHQLEPTVQLAA
jgi:hypothetical protein